MLTANVGRCATPLLLLLCLAAHALPVLEKPVTLRVRSQPVEEILNEMSRQAGVQFSYDPQAVDVRRPASLDVGGVPLREALRRLLGSGYEYKAVRKFIVLRKSRVEIYPAPPPMPVPAPIPVPAPAPPPPEAEKTEYSYITNQRYVKKMCYTDSGTLPDGCLIITNNKNNSKMMRNHLTAIALAAATSVSAQTQQPSAVSGQLGQAGKDFIMLVAEVADSTAQAVKVAANEIGRQASSLKAAAAPAAAADSVRPVVVTLFYPLSFPEMLSERHAYHASFTWLYGINSGVKDVEIAAGLSVNRRYMSGVQVAGLANLSLGSVTGAQAAGVANFAGRDTVKAQLAGVANVAQSARFQAALISNVAYRNGQAQLAGVANVSPRGTSSAQLAGIANVAQNAHFQAAPIGNLAYHNGRVQLAGIANVSTRGTSNAQLACIANAAQSSHVQAAGIANASYRSAAVQLACIANVADTSRCQLGVVNVSRRAGAQVGVVNVCDTSSGVMLGLVNVARRGGLYEFEVSTELVNRLNVAYRMGTKKLYTFAELAYRWDHNLWMPGAGLGTQIPLPKGWGVNVEGASSHVLSGDSWKLDGINMLAHARVSASKQLTKHFAVFAGPTFHVYCTDHTSSSSVDFPAPYHIFSFKDKHTTTKGWVGFSAGIRIN